MLKNLKREVFLANLELPKQKLIKYTWGNVSAIDRNSNLFVIKPSGVNYTSMTEHDMVVCDLDGNIIEGHLKPSSDMPTHAVVYKYFKDIGGICHTHSTWATIWAQAGQDIKALGTTHADHFYGDIPCAGFLSEDEIKKGYEWETGHRIVRTFHERNIQPLSIPAILLSGHGPFTFGKKAMDSVVNAVVLEEIAKMNYFTLHLNPNADLPQYILDKHYLRKHGKDAYYGQ